jgi:2',3'-cyclic-nucleotide 2'-phosphodiesterase (5'-nucleotidase family)
VLRFRPTNEQALAFALAACLLTGRARFLLAHPLKPGNVTYGDVLTAMPFGNVLAVKVSWGGEVGQGESHAIQGKAKTSSQPSSFMPHSTENRFAVQHAPEPKAPPPASELARRTPPR